MSGVTRSCKAKRTMPSLLQPGFIPSSFVRLARDRFQNRATRSSFLTHHKDSSKNWSDSDRRRPAVHLSTRHQAFPDQSSDLQRSSRSRRSYQSKRLPRSTGRPHRTVCRKENCSGERGSVSSPVSSIRMANPQAALEHQPPPMYGVVC
jgi:hypothetical protein